MGFSFIHMADVHLDTPFKSREVELRSLLRDSVRQAFKAGVDYAILNHVDAFVIAGDAFDNDTLSFSTEKFLFNEFKRLESKNIKVFYTPGNHDPYGSSFRLSRICWPSNVYTFRSSKPEMVPVCDDKGNVKAVIVGAGHEGRKEGKNIAAKFPTAEPGVPYIGLLHTLVNGMDKYGEHERYAPCSLTDLEEKGYKYWALGHVHNRVEISNNPYVVYPGNLVGRNPRETGAKGAYFVEIGDLGEVKASFKELAPLRWETFRISCLSDAVNLEDMERRICSEVYKKLDEAEGTNKIIARIILEGPCMLYSELQDSDNIAALVEAIRENINFEYLEIITDGLQRQVEPEQYRSQAHVLGKALDILDMLKTDDEHLLNLRPKILAGCGMKSSDAEVLEYLRGLLNGLDYEVSARLIRGDGGEI